jgi:benzoate/toluate 1,2-dioxygenase reductase subunit
VYTAKFLFADGESIALPVAEDQTILEAAMMQDAPVRYDCTEGACGACVAECIDGDAEAEIGARLPISPAEYADGLRPTCVTRLRSDATFRLPYPRAPAPSDPRRLRGRVAAVERIAETAFRLVLNLDGADGLAFQPGQYLRLRAPGATEARAYSIASTAAALPDVELLIRYVPGGMVSEWLASAAKAGDRVTVQAPLGPFGFDIAAPRHVFVAGGTGLSPVLSMARSLPPGARATLCFGCTRPEDLFFRRELEVLAASTAGLEVRIALMDPGDTGLARGTAVSLLTLDDLGSGASFYLCGPPPMVDAARARLVEGGVPHSRIRAERFAPGG